MNSSEGGPVPAEGKPKQARNKLGRWVGVTLEQRQVCLDSCDEKSSELSSELSYQGILITHYDAEAKISEEWVPLGVDPSEADDEELIQQLRGALLWQAGKQAKDTP
jgi:hypothetical protein